VISPIDSSVEFAIRERLQSQLPGTAGGTLSSEIQDRGEFLLLCIDLSSSATWTSPTLRRQFLEAASKDLERDLPAREGDYRWMIVVRQDGEVVDSIMGGWSGRATV
jgi:hypothetical protein